MTDFSFTQETCTLDMCSLCGCEQGLAFLNGFCTCGAYFVPCFSKKCENVQTLQIKNKKKKTQNPDAYTEP